MHSNTTLIQTRLLNVSVKALQMLICTNNPHQLHCSLIYYTTNPPTQYHPTDPPVNTVSTRHTGSCLHTCALTWAHTMLCNVQRVGRVHADPSRSIYRLYASPTQRKDLYTCFYSERHKSFRSLWMVYSTATLKGPANGRVKMIRLKIQNTKTTGTISFIPTHGNVSTPKCLLSTVKSDTCLPWWTLWKAGSGLQLEFGISLQTVQTLLHFQHLSVCLCYFLTACVCLKWFGLTIVPHLRTLSLHLPPLPLFLITFIFSL